jgi:hypothetical protein
MTPTYRPANSAYQGAWRHDATGTRFVVFYVNGDDAAYNRVTDEQPQKAGWYWQGHIHRVRSSQVEVSERFQSSRAAWHDARVALANKSSTVTATKEIAA